MSGYDPDEIPILLDLDVSDNDDLVDEDFEEPMMTKDEVDEALKDPETAAFVAQLERERNDQERRDGVD